MKVNLTPPVEDAALIQTPSFRKLSLSFICLGYGKRSHCLTDMVVIRLVTKQARALFDKLHKLGTPSEIFLFFDLLTQFVKFETGLSDVNLDT